MSPRRTSPVDFGKLFNTVTQVLKENQQPLNTVDEYNHNHGDNMVNNFQVITRAVRAKKGSSPSEQLKYASEVLNQRAQSGSARLYSQGLALAAERFKGKTTLTQEDAMFLVQALMGGQSAQAQSGGGDTELLGSLLGQTMAPQQGQAAGGDLLGGLLGALTGSETAQQPVQTTAAQGDNAFDLEDLLTAGLAFVQARKQGATPVAALVQAVMAGSQMQASPHHLQSGQLVAETLINTLGTMLARKK